MTKRETEQPSQQPNEVAPVQKTVQEVKRMLSELIRTDDTFSQVFNGVGIGAKEVSSQEVPCVQLYLGVRLTEDQMKELPTEIFGVPINYIFGGKIEAYSSDKQKEDHIRLYQTAVRLLLTENQ
jgi:hypothetical protein